MISLLRLTNFKIFQEQSLEFKSLTVLSGINSSGKSSVLQSLLLLRQSYQQGLLENTGLALNGDWVCIGTAKDALCEAAKEESIRFEIGWENGIKGIWRFHYDTKEADVLTLVPEPISTEVYKSSLFQNKFNYLNAERIGSRVFNEMSDYQVRHLAQVGVRGEYTAHFLSVNQHQKIPNLTLEYPKAKSLELIDQVEAWMREVSPGTRIKIKDNVDLDVVSLQYSYGDSNPYRATNVGFGISYTLPIIVAILASEPGSLILLENPEAHLHPKGQAKMGELFALAASCGVQIVVETHSDHILNGIRLAVHGGKLDPNDVQLHYFQRKETRGESKTEVISPRMDRNGRIDNWPDGFFDEWKKNLAKLIQPIGS